MNVKIVVDEAEEGGFWAEVPALPGCVRHGETMDEAPYDHEHGKGRKSRQVPRRPIT